MDRHCARVASSHPDQQVHGKFEQRIISDQITEHHDREHRCQKTCDQISRIHDLYLAPVAPP